MIRRPARCAAWLAALAMALQALWPLIAQAKPATLVPVCTVGGTTHYIELPDGSTPVDSHQEHCAFCVAAAALPTHPVNRNLGAFSFSTPHAVSFTPRSFVVVNADARAPPVLPWVSFNYGRNHEEDAFVLRAVRSNLGGSLVRLGVLHG